MNTLLGHHIAVSALSPIKLTTTLATGLTTIVATTALTMATMAPSIAQLQPSAIPEDTSHLLIPVARVNPEQPISIIIFNDTSIPLEYGFSTNNIAPQELAVGENVTLNSTPIPTSLLINAFTSTAILDYAIESIAEDNTLLVTVSLVNQLYDAAGFSAIDIHETGAIYRY